MPAAEIDGNALVRHTNDPIAIIVAVPVAVPIPIPILVAIAVLMSIVLESR